MTPGLRGGRPTIVRLSHGTAVTRPRRSAAQQTRRVYTEHMYSLLGFRGVAEWPGEVLRPVNVYV